MPKKNSGLIQSDCKLNANPIYIHFEEIFLRVTESFDDSTSTIQGTEDNRDEPELTPEQFSFFKKLYCPTKALESIDPLCLQMFPELSGFAFGENEWDLIRFCTNYTGKWNRIRLLPVAAPMGFGKTSLIYYTLLFLRSQVAAFRQKVIPIFFNLHAERNTLNGLKDNAAKLTDYIQKELLHSRIRAKLAEQINITNDNFWDWYYHICQTEYRDKVLDLQKSLKGEESIKAILELRKAEKDRVLFPLVATKYLTEKMNRQVVVVFDNLDPLNISIVEHFVWAAKWLIQYSSVRVIYTIRTSTLRKLKIKMLGVLPPVELFWTRVPTAEILRRRCTMIDSDIVEEYKKRPIMVGNIEINVSDVRKALNAIIEAMTANDGSNAIKHFSVGDIRKQMKLLRIVFYSGLLPEWMWGSAILSEANLREVYKIHDYLITAAIVTNQYTTFFSQGEFEAPGVINIFCSDYYDIPISRFSRLIILGYLMKNQRDQPVLVSRFWDALSYIIHGMENSAAVSEAFCYSLMRLLNQGLIASPDSDMTVSLSDIKNLEHIEVTPLGRFYVEKLARDPNYLVYVKDDVSLPSVVNFKGCDTIRREFKGDGKLRLNEIFLQNLEQTAQFLKTYADMEIDFLKSLQEQETLLYFRESFGYCEENLYSLTIAGDLLEYCKLLKSGGPLVKTYKSVLKSIYTKIAKSCLRF